MLGHCSLSSLMLDELVLPPPTQLAGHWTVKSMTAEQIKQGISLPSDLKKIGAVPLECNGPEVDVQSDDYRKTRTERRMFLILSPLPVTGKRRFKTPNAFSMTTLVRECARL